MKSLLIIAVLFFLTGCGSRSSERYLYVDSSAAASEAPGSIPGTNLLPDTIVAEGEMPEEAIPAEENDAARNSLKMLELYPGIIDTVHVAPHPRKMIAIYTDAVLGDYFHLIFTDEKGQEWDFGNGENQLGKYNLYLETEEAPNPVFRGKKFEVTWDSVMTKYLCCEGGMEVVEGRQPSIIGLKLLEQ